MSVCEQAGARSVSDLARNAVQRLIADGQRSKDDHSVEDRIQVLERLIGAVTEQLYLLSSSQGRDAAAPQLANHASPFFPEGQPTTQNGQGEE